MKKASVIIPAHNEEVYIAKTLKALNHPDIETIVVCNGCTDRTEDVARGFKTKIVSLPERGVSNARNKGAEIALGEKLVFLDADIVVAEDTIQKILDSDCSIGTSKAVPDTHDFMPTMVMAFKNLLNHFGKSTGLIFCDREVFDSVGGFKVHMSKMEDGTFVREAKGKGKFGVVDSFVVNNMRRFRKLGYSRLTFYWLREWLFPTDKEYEVIR
jgi:glycosyltransferase involved in cell wall biosynthesis